MTLRQALFAGAGSALVITVGAAFGVYAADDDDAPQPVVYSYDAGDDTARVYAACVGEDAVYQMGNTDDWWVAPGSGNCAEGGFLLDAGNDVWLEQMDKRG